MTYREMLLRDHPELIGGCPGSHYDGAPALREECALFRLSNDATEEECTDACVACWFQEADK